jgi:hypothetical protein
MYLQPVIVELGDALRGCNQASWLVLLEAHDRSRSEEYMEEVDLAKVDREGCATAAETLFIG